MILYSSTLLKVGIDDYCLPSAFFFVRDNNGVATAAITKAFASASTFLQLRILDLYWRCCCSRLF